MGSKDGVFKLRPHLADVTNRPAKRPFSLISGDGDGASQFTKQTCFGVESLAKNKLQFEDRVSLQPKEKRPNLLPFCDDASRSLQKPIFPNKGREEQNALELENFKFGESGEDIVPTDRAVETGEKDVCAADNLGSPKRGTVQMPAISASRDSQFLGLKPCSGHKGDGGANSATDAADIKSCTCTFCSTAAYMWSDLHYQDAKGRLSAIKKSQKEVKTIIQKISGLEDTVVRGQHQSEEASKLELSLVNQWKSLFVQMQNIYAQESSQLESSFGTLKDLRENCKNDLESNDISNRESQ
ncbi:hypothetical protein Fmac_004324 [Flemingia macrophylla]|uniref:Uncharacterized protein n=1 Tax=Flemingia macrophylla TaxID=520843 RepID=A0ABD1N4K6_9FABA